MKLLSLFPAVFLILVSYSSSPVSIDLQAVGLTVELEGDSWIMWTDQTFDIGEDGRLELGVSYLMDANISESEEWKFDEFHARRRNNYNADELAMHLRGEIDPNLSSNCVIGEEVFFAEGELPFEQATVFHYSQKRGVESHKRSEGYIVYAVHDDRAYQIVVAGIESQFQADEASYRQILRSITIR